MNKQSLWPWHRPARKAEARRLMLTAEDFSMLVRGQVVARDGVVVELADIGHGAMAADIYQASKGT